MFRQHLSRWPPPRIVAGGAQSPLTDQWQGEMRQLREVTGGTHAALIGDHWEQLSLEEQQQPLRQIDTYT